MRNNLKDTIFNSIQRHLEENIEIALPAVIVSVSDYESKQVIDVKPTISDIYPDNETLEYPTIYSVPVTLIQGGGALISVPLKVGDIVTLMFSKHGLDSWLQSTGESSLAVSDFRKFNLTDCYAFPGGSTLSKNLSPNPDDLEVKFKDSSILLKESGDIELNTGGNLTMNVTGDVNINSAALNHNGTDVGEPHTHGGVQTGGGNTTPPN